MVLLCAKRLLEASEPEVAHLPIEMWLKVFEMWTGRDFFFAEARGRTLAFLRWDGSQASLTPLMESAIHSNDTDQAAYVLEQMSTFNRGLGRAELTCVADPADAGGLSISDIGSDCKFFAPHSTEAGQSETPLYGVLRFVGYSGMKNPIAGIEVSTAIGESDGSFGGVTYFRTQNRKGAAQIMVCDKTVDFVLQICLKWKNHSNQQKNINDVVPHLHHLC